MRAGEPRGGQGWCCTPAGCACSIFVCIVLAVLLTPVASIQRVPPGRGRISCVSNLKQLYTAVLMYSQDYDDRLPRAAQWMDATLPYYKNWQICQCPTVGETNPPPTGAPADKYGYGYDGTLAFKRTTKLSNPAARPLLYDTHLLYKSVALPIAAGLCRPGRHNGGDNVAYLDGHAKRLPVAL